MVKKAAIVTYWNTEDNYGTVLQNFALQKFLSQSGIESITIRDCFFAHQSTKEKLLRNLHEKGLISVLLRLITLPYIRIRGKINEKKNRKRNFEQFRISHMKFTETIYDNYDKLLNEQADYDLYIAGSDQIWNFGKYDVRDLDTIFKTVFFDFANKAALKISCAASFGNPSFTDEVNNSISEYLSKFDFVSVREQKGVDFCKRIGIENAELQYDPTFLHSAEFYGRLFSGIKKTDSKYVLLYLLNNSSDFSVAALKKWAKKKNLKLVYVNGNLFVPKITNAKCIYPTVNEWLSLISNAEYVFTNSFHGTVFSIIFNKKFLTIKQTKEFRQLNNRVEELLKEFNLQNRFYSNDFVNVEEEINYLDLNTKLDTYRYSSPFVNYIKTLQNS